MDYPLVFAELFPGENVSPVVGNSGVTYAQISQTWRGSTAIPSEETLQSTWESLILLHPEYALTGADLIAAIARKVAKLLAESDPTADGRIIRALAVTTLGEVNDLRQWIAAFKVQVAAATSLANLQTRVAALPAMPDRTKAQLIAAIKNKIDANE
jgi:hypothetical protein